MTYTSSTVALKSTPRFQLILQDGDRIFYPEYVLYQVQAQRISDLDWESVGEVKRLEPTSNVIDIFLKPDETDIVSGCNLNRRLIVQVCYTDKGQTLNTSQSIEFILEEIPTLSQEYHEGESEENPEPAVVSGEAFPRVSQYKYEFSLNTPISKIVSAEVGQMEPTTEEVLYEEASAYLLTGNISGLILFSPDFEVNPDVEIFIRLRVKTLVKQEERELVFTLMPAAE